jgi:hypothetical protein
MKSRRFPCSLNLFSAPLPDETAEPNSCSKAMSGDLKRKFLPGSDGADPGIHGPAIVRSLSALPLIASPR